MATKKEAITKRYWASREEDLDDADEDTLGYGSPEAAADAECVADGEVVVIYELVPVGKFRVGTSVTLTKIK
jgi:hypothetical protein